MLLVLPPSAISQQFLTLDVPFTIWGSIEHSQQGNHPFKIYIFLLLFQILLWSAIFFFFFFFKSTTAQQTFNHAPENIISSLIDKSCS